MQTPAVAPQSNEKLPPLGKLLAKNANLVSFKMAKHSFLKSENDYYLILRSKSNILNGRSADRLPFYVF
jgi:hypothetical protein